MLDDGRFAADAPQANEPRSLSLMGIDQYSRPYRRCPNGHIVEWISEYNGQVAYAAYLVRFTLGANKEVVVREVICPIDGEAAVDA